MNIPTNPHLIQDLFAQFQALADFTHHISAQFLVGAGLLFGLTQAEQDAINLQKTLDEESERQKLEKQVQDMSDCLLNFMNSERERNKEAKLQECLTNQEPKV